MSILTKAEIERKAHQTLIEHGMFCIPVDPVVIANRLGIRVSNAVFSDSSLSGMIAQRGEKKLLLVNNNDSAERKRFTIAHELGHSILHLDNAGEFVDSATDLFRTEALPDGKTYHQEVEANAFAAALLMDAELVKRLWDTCKSLDTMAKAFMVSESAMGIRLNNLGLT